MKRLILLSTVFVTCLLVTIAHADIYVSSSGIGSQDGTNCANARSAAWFNTAGNWGGGGTNIDPGDTVRLCGTFVGAANSTILTVQASGTSGNVITILFEADAKLQAPYFHVNGAINLNGKDYIKIDGGTNGIIQGTDNGSVASGKTYHASTTGINSNGGSDIEICNLTIQNLFINTGGNSSGATDATGLLTSGILFDDNSGNYSNISIHHNTINNSRAGIWVNYEGIIISTINIYNNSLSDHGWMIVIGAGVNNSVATGIDIYKNTMTDWNLWQYPTGAYHTNGLGIFSNAQTNASYTGKFRDNYVYGSLGAGSPTGYVGTGCGGNNFLIYNNIFKCVAPDRGGSCMVVYNAGGCEGSNGVQPINTTFYNNTCIGLANGTGNSWEGLAIRAARANTNMTVKNNIFINYHHPLEDTVSGYLDFSGTGVTDYNLYYGQTYVVIYSISDHKTLAEWQASPYNQEAHGLYGDPLLDALYRPGNGSPAIGAGVDLSGIFTTDKNGTIRSVPWDIGAQKPLRPPRNLRIIQP